MLYPLITKAYTCKETLLAFQNLRTKLGLEHTSRDKFFDQLGLVLINWKVKKIFEQLRTRFSLKEYQENRSGDCSKVGQCFFTSIGFCELVEFVHVLPEL
jgi:hypothetical protein